MDAIRSCALRYAVRKPPSCASRASQRRWARVHDVRFVATSPQADSVYVKYKDKLDRKAKESIDRSLCMESLP